ncbi:hypothetical protein HUU59_05585 [bacterium]|nr:hypothetical protein [bacterium]
MKSLSTFVTVLLLAACSFAQAPMPDDGAGTRPGSFSARSLGLGHTFLTNQLGNAALMGNPATMAFQTDKWLVGFNADVSRIKETRSYPFYDAFDGVLGYNNYALNDHVYSKLDGGASYRVKQNELESFVISLGSYSAYQFDYTYHEEVRNRFTSGGVQDLVLGKNVLEVTGDLRAFTLGAAAKQGKMAMGFSLSLLTGDWGYDNGVFYANPDSLDQSQHVDYSLDGMPVDVNFGGTYDINERVRVGARALFPTGKLKYEVRNNITIGDSTTSTTADGRVTYPAHIAAGVQYRPQNEYRPQVYFESELHTFSQVDDGLNDVLEFRAGAEQQIVPGTPARFGIVYATSPSDKDRATTLFTAGIGFTLRRMHADFGLEFGEMNYAADDLFPQSLYGETDREDRDRVETAVFRGMMSLTWEL